MTLFEVLKIAAPSLFGLVVISIFSVLYLIIRKSLVGELFQDMVAGSILVVSKMLVVFLFLIILKEILSADNQTTQLAGALIQFWLWLLPIIIAYQNGRLDNSEF